MASTIEAIFAAAGLIPSKPIQWGQRHASKKPGVYVVALTNSSKDLSAALEQCPVSLAAIEQWIARRREFKLDGAPPRPDALAARIAAFWVPDEVVLYVGHTTLSLNQRLDQLYGTPLGAKRPHAGGHFLKTLENLKKLWVHSAEAANPRVAEEAMLKRFVEGMSAKAIAGLFDPQHPMPFANLEWPPGVEKKTGLRRDKGAIFPVSRSTDAYR